PDRAATPATGSSGEESPTLQVAHTGPGGNVIVVEHHLRAKARSGSSSRRRVIGTAVACMALAASVGWGAFGLVRGELGHRLIELRACGADVMAANRDCALLAWFPL